MKAVHPARKTPHSGRGVRIMLCVVGVLLLLVMLVQVVGSPIATAWANRKLATLPDYRGEVRTVRLELWHLAITAHDLALVDRKHEAEGPVLKVGKASVALAPLALLRGKIGGRGAVKDVVIAVVRDPEADKKAKESKSEAEKKAKPEGPTAVHAWQGALEKSFPIEVTRFEITGLQVTVANRATAIPPQILLEDFQLVATGFRTKAANAGDLPAKLTVRSRFHGGGTLTVNATADTGATQPTFKATMEVKDLALVPLHDLVLAAVNVDVAKGTFELFVEVAAEGGHYDGYVKPFFKDLEFKSVPDPDKNFAQRAATSVASAVTDLLKNDEGKVATKVPFKGNFADAEVDVWTTIENLLRNAFIQSLREGFEGAKPTG